MILLGDCLERLKELEPNSVDAVVTDPPYGLSFMGKKWDYDVPAIGLWCEVLRVLKPGGHLLSFGGTRTYHRMVVAIEDAGFEIRDQLQWLYGSGFPKSLDISKAIDKAAGAEREVVGYGKLNPRDKKSYEPKASNDIFDRNKGMHKLAITEPATDSAKQWQGWGTALKPANEPICLARKPLEKGLTVAQNVLKWGVGGLNIDESRIAGEANRPTGLKNDDTRSQNKAVYGNPDTIIGGKSTAQGRWPANLLLDEEAAAMLDEQSGLSKSAVRKVKPGEQISKVNTFHSDEIMDRREGGFSDSGGASRFFYVAKASKRERNAGLEGMPMKANNSNNNPSRMVGSSSKKALVDDINSTNSGVAPQANHHPTVKPLKLMEYLIKLITPPGGTILDPFLGSGTTAVMALKNGRKFIGIEIDEEYIKIAERRIAHAKTQEAE